MKLKLDLHIHSALSADGRMSLREIVEAARKAGLDGVAVCDHDQLFSAPPSLEGEGDLIRRCAPPSPKGEGDLIRRCAPPIDYRIPFPQHSCANGEKTSLSAGQLFPKGEGDLIRRCAPLLEMEGVLVIPGEEFSTEYGHVLGLFLTEPVSATEFDGIAREIHAQGGLCVLAHPFERHADAARFLPIVDRLDGIEVQNSRANRKNRRANEMAAAFAAAQGLPAFAGSDAHLPREVGGSCVVVEAADRSPAAVKAALCRLGNEVRGRDGRQLDVARSQWTKRRKTGWTVGSRLQWLAFALKCAAGDLCRRQRRN